MMTSSENKSNILTNSLLITVIVIAVVGFSITYFANLEKTDVTEETTLKTGYQVQNLMGDTLSTYIGWKPISSALYFIDGADRYPDEKIQIIHDVFHSEETIEVSNKLLHKYPLEGTTTFYKGWIPVANELRKLTGKAGGEPIMMKQTETKQIADIVIELVDYPNPEGYVGWTSSTIDPSTEQVVRSTVTLYNFNKLSLNHVEIITRHEIGHVAGLAHSTDPQDLMYPVIETNYPYISPCNILTFKAVQLGEFETEIICDE